MRVTQKGQVTIPKEVRDALGIRRNGEVSFELGNGFAKITRAVAKSIESQGQKAIRLLKTHKKVRRALATDEIVQLMRGH